MRSSKPVSTDDEPTIYSERFSPSPLGEACLPQGRTAANVQRGGAAKFFTATTGYSGSGGDWSCNVSIHHTLAITLRR